MDKTDAAYHNGYRHGEKEGYKQGYRDAIELETTRRIQLDAQLKALSESVATMINPPPILACRDCPKIKFTIREDR